MRRRHIIVLALAAGLVLLTSVATARPSATKQQVEITAKGVNAAHQLAPLKFVLTPLGTGALKPDSGSETSVVANQRTVTRDGQTANIVTWISTCKGKRGSFVMRVRIEHVDAGNGFHIGTGTWRFVRGTGAYAGITGGGRVANAWVDFGSQALSERRDGFLTLP
jgi:hypothetical protein